MFRFKLACLVLILLLATGLRLWQLGKVPVSLYWDEAAMLVDVKSIVQSGLDMHGRAWFQVIYPSYGDYKLPVYIWLASASALLFGVSEWALRLPSALAGVGTVVVAGWLAGSWFGKEKREKFVLLEGVALWTMFVVAVTPWSIVFSHSAFEGHLAQFLLAASVACIVKAQKKASWYGLAVLLGTAATYSYFSVRFVWFGVFVMLQLAQVWQVWQLRKPIRQRQTELLALGLRSLFTILLFGVFLLPMFRSPLYADSNRFRLNTDSVLKNDDQILQSNVDRELAGNTPFDRIAFHRTWLSFQELLKNYSDNTSPNFLFVTGDPNLRHGTGLVGLFLFPMLFPFLLGWWIIFRKRPELGVIFLSWWLFALLPASVPENTPHALRSLNALVPLSIVIGVGCLQAWSVLGRFKKPVPAVLRISMIGALLVFAVFFAVDYFSVYPVRSADSWQVGYAPLTRAMEKNRAQNTDLITYVLPFDDRFYLWLMAYGPYTAKDFHQWRSEQYQFSSSIHAVLFRTPDTGLLESIGELQVAGRPDQIQPLLQTISRKPLQLESIKGEDGKIQFMIALFTTTQQ